MDKIFSPIKRRIIEFIENQKIKKEFFYKKIEISSSNFKGPAAKSELGGDIIGKIITFFPLLNPEWLLTGNGEMLKKNNNVGSVIEDENDYINKFSKKIETMEDEILRLKRTNDRLLNTLDEMETELKKLKKVDKREGVSVK